MKSEWSFKKNDTQCSGTKEDENLKKSKKHSLHGPMEVIGDEPISGWFFQCLMDF